MSSCRTERTASFASLTLRCAASRCRRRPCRPPCPPLHLPRCRRWLLRLRLSLHRRAATTFKRAPSSATVASAARRSARFARSTRRAVLPSRGSCATLPTFARASRVSVLTSNKLPAPCAATLPPTATWPKCATASLACVPLTIRQLPPACRAPTTTCAPLTRCAIAMAPVPACTLASARPTKTATRTSCRVRSIVVSTKRASRTCPWQMSARRATTASAAPPTMRARRRDCAWVWCPTAPTTVQATVNVAAACASATAYLAARTVVRPATRRASRAR
mmetsp:Transcript_11895/g.37814  ORF Transcript_11895/g.37814 Transcript_11895/m.37814 type:complete len:278 (+) Transcript_11895:353-1186(+)